MSGRPTERDTRPAWRRVAVAAVLGAFALAVGVATAGADEEARVGTVRAYAASSFEAPTSRLLMTRAAAAYWGGTYTTSTGEAVRIEVSNAYPRDPALPQRWANYLASLVHGPELATVTAYIAPFDEVQSICGEEALACYSSRIETLVAPGESPSSAVTAEAIVAHEYGHHVAASRSNAPWAAVNYGTKRWASHLNVCARAQDGELFPGAQDGERYGLDPGEGFAEAYRMLNQQRLGQPLTPWRIVSPTFIPDATALQLLEQDVRTPWTGPTTSRVGGTLVARRTRTSAVATPLDGTARVTVSATRGTVTADILAGTRRLARLTASAGRSQARSLTVCGQRSLRLRVTAGRTAARYSAAVVRP